MTERSFDPVVPQEGWHVLHLFYRVEYGQWQLLGADEQRQAKTNLSLLIQEIRATEETQLLAFSVVTPKADLGFMLLTPDLQTANAFEKRLNLSLGADVLTPVYSYLSMTERSEYTTSEADYIAETLEKEKGLDRRDARVRRRAGGFPHPHGQVRQGPALPQARQPPRAVLLQHGQTPRGETKLVSA